MTAPTPKPQRAGLVDVTQADRDAAATYLSMIPGFPPEDAEKFRRGEFDALADALPQHFACHREAAIEKLAEALRSLAFFEADYRNAHDIYGDGSRQAGRAWDLMRRAGDKARAALSSLGGEGRHG